MTKFTQFTIADPREFDGTPYEVAKLGCDQAQAVLRVLKSTVPPLRLMVRNAELERQMALGGKPNPLLWEDGPQAAKLAEAIAHIEKAERLLGVLGQAAGFDPKAR